MPNLLLPPQAQDGQGFPISNVFEPSGTTQKLATTGSSTPFATDTVVRIVSDADCHYKVGTAPTATTSDVFLPSKSGEQILIRAGNIINVLGANLYVTPLT